LQKRSWEVIENKGRALRNEPETNLKRTWNEPGMNRNEAEKAGSADPRFGWCGFSI